VVVRRHRCEYVLDTKQTSISQEVIRDHVELLLKLIHSFDVLGLFLAGAQFRDYHRWYIPTFGSARVRRGI
jgi:hypothetical protein